MSESGSYDEATLARKYAMAQALMKGPEKPITHWAQGLDQLGKAALGTWQMSQLDDQREADKAKSSAELYSALGLPVPDAGPAKTSNFEKIASLIGGNGWPGPAAAPQPAPVPQGGPMGAPQPQPGPSPVIGPNDPSPLDGAAWPAGPVGAPGAILGPNDPSPLDTAPYPAGPMGAPGGPAMPRGLRNNNPLNIEAGSFTRGQPGFAGSDGRFAKFESPDQGAAAASKLLDTYQSKYGLNTPAGIIGRWAPQGENNSNAYAATIAKKLGIGPNDPIPPEMRPQLIAAMSEVENGKPAAVNAIASALQGGASGAPTTAAAAPAPAAAAGGGGILAGVPTAQRAQIAALLTSNNPTAKAMGTALLQQSIKPNDFGFQTQPDGTILRTDPRKGTVEPVYQGATKPTFGVIGESEDGKKTYGFIDTAKGKVTPLGAAKPGDDRPTVTGPDGKEIVIPKGVDVKSFKTEVTKATADAATGKKTEVQGAAEQFANRLESAEKNFKGVGTEGVGLSGAAQTAVGNLPLGIGSTMGGFAQTSNFQKMEQAKREFVTALLRKESGAAIGKEEYTQYDKQFFPQPGDKPEVIAQKTEARRVAIDAMKKTAGPGYKSPTAAPAAAPVTKSIGGKEYYQENGQWYEK